MTASTTVFDRRSCERRFHDLTRHVFLNQLWSRVSRNPSNSGICSHDMYNVTNLGTPVCIHQLVQALVLNTSYQLEFNLGLGLSQVRCYPTVSIRTGH